MRDVLSGFKEFIARGNAIELAIGVVIGTAFTALVNALVNSLVMPLIAAIFGKPNFDEVGNFTINGADFSIGTVITALVNFFLVALALYFFIVLPLKKLRDRGKREVPEEPGDTRTELDVLKQIQVLLADQQSRSSGGSHAAPPRD